MKRICLITAMILAACSEREAIISQSVLEKNSDVIPVEEAMEMVINHARILYPETRAGLKLNVSEVILLTKDVIIPATRADARPDIPDTTLYVFNFADDLGYAVTSANKKYGNTLFCITELGSLSADDFKPMRTRADGDSLATGNNCTHFITDLITASIMSNEIAPPIDSTEIGGGPSGIIGPFLKTKWGQDDSPINDSIPNNAPAGCACIALSQIMAFEEYSNTMVFNGITCNWSDIKTVYTYPNIYYPGSNTEKVQVASFIKALGTSTNLDINYNNGSGGTITKAKTTLQNYGYSNVTLTPALAPSPTFTQEMKSKVRSQLFSGHPVYARGNKRRFYGPCLGN